jgi:hypothetical protein
LSESVLVNVKAMALESVFENMLERGGTVKCFVLKLIMLYNYAIVKQEKARQKLVVTSRKMTHHYEWLAIKKL